MSLDQPHTIKLQLPKKETVIKATKLSGGLGSLAGAVYLIVNIAFFEPQLTPRTNARIDDLKGEVAALQITVEQKTKGIASNPRLLELEGKTKMLAREIDTKASREDILQMELRLVNKMDENLKEIVRLMAQKQKNTNGRAE